MTNAYAANLDMGELPNVLDCSIVPNLVIEYPPNKIGAFKMNTLVHIWHDLQK